MTSCDLFFFTELASVTVMLMYGYTEAVVVEASKHDFHIKEGWLAHLCVCKASSLSPK